MVTDTNLLLPPELHPRFSWLQPNQLAYVPLSDVHVRYLSSSESLTITLVETSVGTATHVYSTAADSPVVVYDKAAGIGVMSAPDVVVISDSDDHTQDLMAEV